MAAATPEHDLALQDAEALKKEGNELLAKGDFGTACTCYDNGLLKLIRVPEELASPLRLALHLNASLAHLNRGNLASAVEHASGALAIDSKSVKALYRRGTARARLSEHSGHESEGPKAKADLEALLELDPQNAEARAQLQRLKATAKPEKATESEKAAFRSMFSKPLYVGTTTAAPPTVSGPVLRPTGVESKRLMLSIEDLKFSYVRGETVLDGVNLELRAGWSVGLLGVNASGKTTLARLLIRKIFPESGQIVHHGTASSSPGSSTATALTANVAVVLVAVGVAAALDSKSLMRSVNLLKGWHWALAAALLTLLVYLLKILLDYRAAGASRHTVMHISSDGGDKEEIHSRSTIESVISQFLPKHLKGASRRQCVINMLKAGFFQMYNQETGDPVGSPEEYVQNGLQFGVLSGGQKHLIYILRCFAANPAVLVCDELLGGLDIYRQPRVLHMLRMMKEQAKTAILYIGTDLHQMRLACDSLAVLHEGRICELGPIEDILDLPKHPFTKHYVQEFRSLPGGRVIGGKLAESYEGIKDDKDLAGDWLPC